jgi:hypothetical protein
MRKLIILTIIILATVVSGCSVKINPNAQIEFGDNSTEVLEQENINLQSELKELKNTKETVESSEMKACPEAVNGLYFDYPSDWGDCWVSDNVIYFRTGYEKYNVDLEVTLVKSAEERYYKLRDTTTLLALENEDNGEFYEFAQGGNISGGMVKVDNDYYDYVVNLQSNEPIDNPQDYLGFVGEHNVTRDEVFNILKTIRK